MGSDDTSVLTILLALLIWQAGLTVVVLLRTRQPQAPPFPSVHITGSQGVSITMGMGTAVSCAPTAGARADLLGEIERTENTLAHLVRTENLLHLAGVIAEAASQGRYTGDLAGRVAELVEELAAANARAKEALVEHRHAVGAAYRGNGHRPQDSGDHAQHVAETARTSLDVSER